MQVLFCNPRISFIGIYQRERVCSQPANFVDEVARTLVIGLGARGYINDRFLCDWLADSRTLLASQHVHRINFRRAACRQEASNERDAHQ